MSDRIISRLSPSENSQDKKPAKVSIVFWGRSLEFWSVCLVLVLVFSAYVWWSVDNHYRVRARLKATEEEAQRIMNRR